MGDEIIGMNTRDQITLKVFIEATKLRKAFRFSVDSTVHEVLVDIRNKTHGASAGDYKFGLFLPPNRETGAKGFWLQENRKIRFYGFSMETEVEYKTKERPLKVKLIDDRILTVKIDDSLTAREICNIVAEKLNIKGSDEFALSKPCPETMSKARPWLVDGLTLHEQDVSPDDTLEFAKRYFFNDDFVDPEDPYTLHLLYVGANKAIIEGTYPVKAEEAVELAGYAVQITYGDHNPKIHVPGFLDPMMFLPRNLRKDWKKLEKLILKQHEKCFRTKETVAKFRYIQKVRALDTYGITFFECQECIEKKGGRQKWKPVLIGITKDKIMKVDFETQELHGEWTWTQIARWSSKNDTFLFDFGDYAKEYLTIRSTETEALNSLVSGYIELILKNLQDVAADGGDDSDDIAEIEEITGDFDFAQAGATATYNHPYFQGGLGQMLWDPSRYGNIDPGQVGPWAESSPAMMTNAYDMGSALKASKMLSDELATQKGKWGNKGAVKESDWNKHFEASNSAMASRMEDILNTVALGAGGKLNRQQLDMKSQDLVVQMMNMTTAARALAAYNDDKSALLDGAKAVADCVSDLMQLLNSTCDDPLGAEALKEALEACKVMFANSEMLLHDPSLITYIDKGAELLMLKCVEDVDRSLQGLTNIVSRGIEDLPKQQQNVLMIDVNKVNAVRGIAISSLAQLVPYSLNPTILDKIQISSKTLQVLSTSTLNSAIAMVPSVYHNQLEAGAKRVTDALQNLMMASKTAELKATADVDLSTPLKKVLLETVTIKNNIDDREVTQKSLSQIKELDSPINKAFTALQKITPKQNKNMLDSAYVEMLAAEKVIMEAPKLNVGLVENFTNAVNVLDKASQSGTALNQLRTATKVLLASLMSLGTDIHLISPSIDDQNQATILIEYSTNVQSGIPKIINALQNSSLDPQNIAKALELVSLVKTQLPTQSQLSTEAKRAARDIADLNERQKLDMSAGDVQRNLQDLVAAAKLVSDIAGLTEVDKAMGGFDLIHAQLEQIKSEIEAGQLAPVQRQSKENANAMLKGGLQSIDIALAEMNAVNKGAAGLVAPIRSILTGLSQCVASTLPLIAATPNKAQQDRLYDLANNLYDVVYEVAAAAKFNQIEKENPKRLEARDASVVACKELLAKVLAEAESMNNQEYDQLVDSIEKAKKALNRNEVVQNISFAQASAALPIAGKPIKANCMQIATALKLDPISAPRYNTVLAENVINLLQLSSTAASAIPDVSTANSILDVARSLADASKEYIIKAHEVQKAPSAEGFQELADAEAKVNECLQKFNFGAAGTTSEDCKRATDKISNLLDNINKLEAEASSTADLRQEFISSTKDVANLLGALVSTARASNTIDNGLVAKETAGALYHVLAAAKSAKVSDGSREPYSLDAVRICKGMNEIMESDDPKTSLQAAKKATNNCANLVAQAKQIAKIEKDHETRAQLLAAAQALVDSSTDLSEAAKTAVNKRTPLSIQNLSKVAGEVKANAKKVDDIIRKIKGIQPEAVNSSAADELLNIACEISRSMADVIEKAGAVASNSNDQVASENLVAATNAANEKFALAMNVCAKINPGLIQCENTAENIKQLSNSLGGAQALSKAGKLPASSSDIKATILSCQELIAANKVLVTAAQQSGLQLEAAAVQVDNAMKQLAKRVVGVAGSITDNYAQQQLLATAKGLTDAEISLLVAIPATSTDNPKSLIQLNQAAAQAESELNLLIGQLNVETGFDGMDSSIETIMASLRDINKLGSDLGAKQDYDVSYMELLQASQDLSAALAGLVNADKKNQQAVMNGISQLTATMPKLVSAIRNLSANAPPELRNALQNHLKTIGDTSVGLIGTVNSICRGNEGDVSTLKAQYADISNAISGMLAAAKAGAVGDQLINKAIRDLKEVSNDVNKGRMFSEANVMPIDKNVTISELQKNAFKELKAIKELVGEFPQIVNHSNTELLGNNSTTLAELEKKSIEPVLKTIARIPDKQVQASTLNALKDLVDQSRELVEQSREAVRGNYKAKERVTVLVSMIQADTIKFIEEVKTSSSQAVKGEKELDSFKKAIRDLIANSTGNDDATPNDVIESAREVFQLTSDLVFADNIDAAIETGRAVVPAIGNLLNNCRGVANTCDEKIGEGLVDSSQFVAKAMIKMLEVSKYDKQDPETKGKLEEAASTITTGIDEVVRVLRMIPEARSLTLHGADLNFIAQESLAETIKIVKEQGAEMQASKKLTRTKKGGELDQTDINNALFDAGYAIAAATSAVVGVGAQIQKNRTAALADLTKKSIKTDPTALSALIGSSKETATAITNLAKATKASSYKLDEKQLVGSANGVTLATSHMVSALKAGATEQEAETVAKLIQFNEAVAEATSALMSAVHKASSFNEVVEVTDAPDTGKVKELEIQIRILKLEKAIKREQRKLEAMKNAQKSA